jgi:hypothetical protein
MSISCQFEGKIEVFFRSLERNHAKLEAHQKNSKLFITFFNQILVSIAALNHSVVGNVVVNWIAECRRRVWLM